MPECLKRLRNESECIIGFTVVYLIGNGARRIDL